MAGWPQSEQASPFGPDQTLPALSVSAVGKALQVSDNVYEGIAVRQVRLLALVPDPRVTNVALLLQACEQSGVTEKASRILCQAALHLEKDPAGGSCGRHRAA